MAYLRDNVLASQGWINADETWTYASADDPTYTFTVPTDLTSKYSAGMRIKLTQATGGTKYFIVTKVSYGAPNTTVTVYGGTDYNLENEAITSPFYAVVKAPQGFPCDITKWTVKVTDTSLRTQATPVNGTLYNLGTVTISIPIGAWHVRWEATCQAETDPAAYVTFKMTLSTGNSTESDKEFTAYANSGYLLGLATPMTRSKLLTLAAKTAYYLNTAALSDNQDNIYNRGDVATTVVEAVCAYV